MPNTRSPVPTRKHALYATARTPSGFPLTFRVGQPVDWNTAIQRWDRLDNRRLRGKRQTIRNARKDYTVEHFELRAVDSNGRGLGSDRHTLAFPIPYRQCRTTR